jgi:hypothetical protein
MAVHRILLYRTGHDLDLWMIYFDRGPVPKTEHWGPYTFSEACDKLKEWDENIGKSTPNRPA